MEVIIQQALVMTLAGIFIHYMSKTIKGDKTMFKKQNAFSGLGDYLKKKSSVVRNYISRRILPR